MKTGMKDEASKTKPRPAPPAAVRTAAAARNTASARPVRPGVEPVMEALSAPVRAAKKAAAKAPRKVKATPSDVSVAGAEALLPLTVRPVEGRPGVSLVQQAVESLRRAVLDAPGPGVFLGSEEQLIAVLGVSRPTFRQAAKLLRHENLIVIKRGMGGGFFTRSPSVEIVSRMAAIFLNAQGTSMQQINEVVAPLQAEAARLLAANPDRAVRARLAEFIEEHQRAEQSGGEKHSIRRMMAFERLLADLAGNPAIALVMNVMLDLVRDARRVYALQTPERIAAYDQFQSRLAQAVLEGDPEMAVLICKRHGEAVRRWLPEDRLELTLSAEITDLPKQSRKS